MWGHIDATQSFYVIVHNNSQTHLPLSIYAYIYSEFVLGNVQAETRALDCACACVMSRAGKDI